MKYILLALLAPVLMSQTCKKSQQKGSPISVNGRENSQADSIPSCLRMKIDSVQKTPVQNPPFMVTEYSYKGKKVFLINSPCCDFFETLIDSACGYIGAPRGGFTGKGDMKMQDFDKEAKEVRIVWKDSR